MLDQGEHPTGHEPGRSHHHAAARHLVDLHHASPGDHLDPAAGPGGDDLVGLRVVATRVDDDLDPVTLHRCPRISGGQGYGRSGSYLSSAPRASPANLRFRIGCRGGKAGAGSRREGRGRLAEGRQGPARAAPPPRATATCARTRGGCGARWPAGRRSTLTGAPPGTPARTPRPSRPVGGPGPRRIGTAWVTRAGTPSTWWVPIPRVGAAPSVASRAIRRTRPSRPPRSRPAAGSSRNSSSGSGISARAIW